ncbi:MAG: hypothetical protein HY700_16160 [Gemmatimonadetes bacterium]|nr:hypothetical protein [Gemmatimonadota bacterium]
MTQSSHRSGGLPASFFLLFLAATAFQSLAAQDQRLRVTREDAFRQEPGDNSRQLATVPVGVEVSGGAATNGWIPVALEGWIWSGSVGRTSRDGHNLAVTASRGENLRIAPNGAVIARLLSGFLLDEVRRDGAWVRVRRTGWMPERSLAPMSQPDTSAAAVADTTTGRQPGAPGSGGSVLDRAVVARESEMTATPEGQRGGNLAAEVPVRVLARSGDWVRVQVEGWVHEADLRPTAPGLVAGLTAAELRSRPEQYEGKLVQWTLQYLSLATADELRPEIPLGRRYLLARGPLPEAGFVYVTLASEHLREVQQLLPLAQIIVVARIRNGRSKYLGNPVVDLVELRVRQP